MRCTYGSLEEDGHWAMGSLTREGGKRGMEKKGKKRIGRKKRKRRKKRTEKE